ncbi:hypothetical protein Taro_013460 [Colocasia esculenta]|uniref:Uncharacterized protein n=1 Tax=Colocasia esculenta TaxID=4460 RepID=A0A843UBM2_COLES|nr:hypothetical protein [Colocasia esculenta]
MSTDFSAHGDESIKTHIPKFKHIPKSMLNIHFALLLAFGGK